MAESWTPAAQEKPADGMRVDWINGAGKVVEGGLYRNRLWFLPPEHSVYRYYEPVFWRPAKEVDDDR